MIIYEELRFGNAFSYGPSNKITLNGAPLVQLVGKNGHGKSSISAIIEEVCFNTNSKKIKKADVLNRYTKDKNYWIELDFNKDGIPYQIITKRTNASSTVKLLKNGEDISGHTATSTYKTIEEILGYDHKTFSQIVYQSSASALEFLVSTDTARKKFLIELLNLSQYTKANEVFKLLASDLSKQVSVIEAKVGTVSAWLSKYSKEPLYLLESVEEPIAFSTVRLLELRAQLKTIDSTNSRIIQNNKYKELLDSVVLEPFTGDEPNRDLYNKVFLSIRDREKKLVEGKSISSKCKGPTIKCPTCSQEMDNSTMFNLSKIFETERVELENAILVDKTWVTNFEVSEAQYIHSQKKAAEYEKYHSLYNPTIDSITLDEASIKSEISILDTEAISVSKSIEDAKKHNKKVLEHNAKVSVIISQLVDMRKELATLTESLAKLVEELSDMQVLAKAFSTTGLTAYKIECLVKDLESITNEYLATLADGRFQISFQVTSSDKLNVVITDNGRDIDILALSSGERARVNVSTLLAIRKLMQSLSNSRTNLLILDETIENLDAEGKEKLIEILLEEESLNTFLISHGFSHPLLEKLLIVKENNISRIE
jgi:DNA repair exonuclease SbcCD ATPase subunit